MITADYRPQEFEIKVPASIANLGPGFDTLALAVQLYLRLRARVVSGYGELRFHFVDHDLHGENQIERAYRHLAGPRYATLPSLEIEVHSQIPMRTGLGSSAAATVAGLRLYQAVAGMLSEQELLDAACALEGHPDNASAALLGGMTASCQLAKGSVRAVSFPWPESLSLVVLTPEQRLGTKQSRSVLPMCLPLADTVYNLQRLALLLHCLQTKDYTALKHALGDRVHQPARQEIVPGLKEALQLQNPDLMGVCLSGSGPSVVAFAEKNPAAVAKLLASVYESLGIAYQIRNLNVHQQVRVPELSESRPYWSGTQRAAYA